MSRFALRLSGLKSRSGNGWTGISRRPVRWAISPSDFCRPSPLAAARVELDIVESDPSMRTMKSAGMLASLFRA